MMYRLPPWTMLTATAVLLAIVVLGVLPSPAPARLSRADATATPEVRVKRDAAVTETARHHPEVTVAQVSTAEYQVSLASFGAVTARYDLELQALVSGKINTVSNSFDNGKLVRQNETLLTIDPTDYEAALATAQANLEEARVTLLEEERTAEQALLEWQDAGLEGEPDSALVLRQPQLAAARANLREAENALTVAQRNLSYTRVTAPFDAVIVERSIAPGSYVQTGATLGQIIDRTRAEVRVALPAKDWKTLPPEPELLSGEWPALLTDVEGQGQWQGYVIRVEHHIEADSRQRHLVIAIDQPLDDSTPLLPGTFVQAQIPGRSLDGLWQLPTSALSQQSEIWYISAESQLAKFSATPVFSDSQHIYVAPPAQLQQNTVQVLTQPLSSYLPGVTVVAANTADLGIPHE